MAKKKSQAARKSNARERGAKKRATRRASRTTLGALTRRARRYMRNCVESAGRENDWSLEDAVSAGFVNRRAPVPGSVDLRRPWWKIRDQGETGACVGFAAADGVLRWLYVENGLISERDEPSPRFIWMANKETDDLTNYPTTFLEPAGTQTKLALSVARKYGCVMERLLPIRGGLSSLSPGAFYARAARLRITSYHNLGTDLDDWRRWIAQKGPILTRLGVDRTWDRATSTDGVLETYLPDTVSGGHAVCLVGYTKDSFIVRNSWGTWWGKGGFAFASNDYAAAAFTEAYGAILETTGDSAAGSGRRKR